MNGVIDRPSDLAGDAALLRLFGAVQRYLAASSRGEEPDPAARVA